MNRLVGKPKETRTCHHCLGTVFIQKECRNTGLVVRGGVASQEHPEGRFVGLICKGCSTVVPKEELKRLKFRLLTQAPRDN